MYNKFIAEGEKTCMDIIRSGTFPLIAMYLTQDGRIADAKLEKMLNPLIKTVTSKQMEQMTALKTSSNCLCVFEKKELQFSANIKDVHKVLYLDRIQDPGNLGTIIRIADWFGIELVVRSEESADFFNPKVVQSTMGSLGAINLATTSLGNLIKSFHYPVYGTFMDGIPVSKIALPEKCIVVIGNEGKGISDENAQLITQKVAIPGNPKRSADSLNAAVATGIICSHWL